MRITASERDGVRVLTCEGVLTIGPAADAFDAACVRATETGVGLVLDLRRLAMLDSAGVGVVVACAKRAGQLGTIVKVVIEPGGPVHRIFHLTQLERAFEIFDGLKEAVASFPR
jgi:anti-sigma B factor antagonist